MKKCDIKKNGKYRNGKQKFWCSIHKSEAFQVDGKLNVCEKFDVEEVSDQDKLYLDPDEWEGGVGLWGALKPVYNTTSNENSEEGIHTHARDKRGGSKKIDDTFKEVYIKRPNLNLFNNNEYIKLDSEIASAYTCSMVMGKKMKYLECKNCGEPHIDADYFSVTYHKKHFCTYCGKDFIDDKPGISNPIIEIKNIFRDKLINQSIKLVDRELIINQKDYMGGIEIWGSNPAIVWTAVRSEEAGIHMHVYNNEGERVHDDTFGRVIIDGVELNDMLIRYLMVQNTLNHLEGRVQHLSCPECGSDHIDRNDLAIRPHMHHLCEYCSTEFSSKIKCVGNPIVKSLKILANNYQLLQKK